MDITWFHEGRDRELARETAWPEAGERRDPAVGVEGFKAATFHRRLR